MRVIQIDPRAAVTPADEHTRRAGYRLALIAVLFLLALASPLVTALAAHAVTLG